MEKITVKTDRNQSLECMRMVAAIVVVFQHISFPWNVGRYFLSLVWYAVPFFLLVTGYFSFGLNCQQIGRRMKHMVSLIALSDITYILWLCVREELLGGSTIALLRTRIPDPDEVMLWAAFQVGLVQRYLWYLWAVVLCYGIQLVYTAFSQKERPDYAVLYAMGFALFVPYGILALLLPAASLPPEEVLYRNGWLTGIPMFTLGLFLRQYGQRLLTSLKLGRGKLLALCVLSFGFAIYQNKTLQITTTPLLMPLGIVALVLLCIQTPRLFPEGWGWARWLVGRFGTWSSGIYLFHMTADSILWFFFFEETPAPWVRPWAVLGLTVLMTLAWDGCKGLIPRKEGRHGTRV